MTELTLFGERDKVADSIKLIKYFEDASLLRNPNGYIVGYSGGKDSDVLLDLFIKSGVRFKAIHNHTTIDAPETVYHIRKKFHELELQGIPCEIHKPRLTFWELCKKKRMLPSRLMRFCCTELKEVEIPEYKFATHSFGVRRAESVSRVKYRDSIETRNNKGFSNKKKFHFDNSEEVKKTGMCYTSNYFIVNPIAYWSDSEVWAYLKDNKIETNPLYSCMSRVGCIGCPMAAKHRVEEFKKYPTYKQKYIDVCNSILERRKAEGKPNRHNFKTGQEYFEWWLVDAKSDDTLDGQMSIDDYNFLEEAKQ